LEKKGTILKIKTNKMKNTIKVNYKNTLTQSELDRIIEDKNTINLT
jgi:hypothetical protein